MAGPNRQRVQAAVNEAKKDKLRTDYGMTFEATDSKLSPEEESEWLDYIGEFERQFEQGKTITVRERISDPPIRPLQELPLYAVDEAVTVLLDLLAAHGIAVDFLGDEDRDDQTKKEASIVT